LKISDKNAVVKFDISARFLTEETPENCSTMPRKAKAPKDQEAMNPAAKVIKGAKASQEVKVVEAEKNNTEGIT
jgi:hypothetical protein